MEPQHRRLATRPLLWVLLFTLIGFALRVQRLDFQPLWGDEGWSFYFATQPLPQLLALTAVDIHPPLYYILLKIWLFGLGVGPETARYFSVVTGTLLIPVVAVLGRRWHGWRVGAVSAVVVAAMPMAVYYSQEVRMYGLVTLLAALSMVFFVTPRRRGWPYLLATAAALYTMYYAAFIVLAQLAYALVNYTTRRRRSLLDTLKPFIVTGLLFLPWLLYTTPKLVDYISNKRAVEGYAPLNLIRFVGDHLVAFSLGHLPPSLQPYTWAVLPALLAAGLGAMALWRPKRTAIPLVYFYLLVPLLAGYLVNLVYPFTPRFFERTLLLVAPAYWLLIGAGLVWLWQKQLLLGGAGVAALLIPVGLGLAVFYSIPRYPDEDYRPLLRDVAAIATPQDTLLASYQWQLGFYQAYLPPPRPRLFAVPDWGAGWSAQAGHADQMNRDLTTIFERSPRLWFPAYQAGGHIWEDEAEAAIARLGFPALLRWYNPQTKLTLAGAGQTPVTQIPGANFNNTISLLSAGVGGQSFQAGRGVVPVQLVWRKEAPLAEAHLVSLRLVDAAGRTWAIRDSQPRAGQVRFTDLNVGQTLTDRHGLLTPAGAPPGQYRLLLSVRRISDAHPLDLLDAAGQPQGAELPLAEITLVNPTPPVGIEALPVQTKTGIQFGDRVQLVGYSLGAGPIKAGESLPLTLFWQSQQNQPDPLTVEIELQDVTGQTIFATQQPPIWPAAQWPRHFILRDPHDVLLPPTLPPANYGLVIGLRAGQSPLLAEGRERQRLQTITTIDRPHRFAAPPWQFDVGANFNNQARLAGIDLPVTRLTPGEVLPLTLYWQAQSRFDKNWTVFVHLIDAQGNIISQQDQPPGGGQYPTTGWVPSEYLVDEYTLQIPPGATPGQYFLDIGLYDVNDFSRLPRIQNGTVVDNHITLESWPISIE